MFECLTFARQETSKSAVLQLFRLKQLSCSALPGERQRFMFVMEYVHKVTWLNLDHEPALDILARALYLHASQTVLIKVATAWQRVWAGNCKQRFKVLMKSSLNLFSAESGCRNASGLLQGKGISISTAGINHFVLCWSSEDGLRGLVVQRAGTQHSLGETGCS